LGPAWDLEQEEAAIRVCSDCNSCRALSNRMSLRYAGIQKCREVAAEVLVRLRAFAFERKPRIETIADPMVAAAYRANIAPMSRHRLARRRARRPLDQPGQHQIRAVLQGPLRHQCHVGEVPTVLR